MTHCGSHNPDDEGWGRHFQQHDVVAAGFVGQAAVEVWVGEGLSGCSGALTAIPSLEVVFSQMSYTSAEVREMVVRDGRGRRDRKWRVTWWWGGKERDEENEET